jgi:hypothetical protein
VVPGYPGVRIPNRHNVHGAFEFQSKTKGKFNFSTITALIADAKAIQALIVETRQNTNAAHEYVKALALARKDWMANADEDVRVLHDIYVTSERLTGRVDQMKQEMDTMQASLQDTYAKAMQLAGP